MPRNTTVESSLDDVLEVEWARWCKRGLERVLAPVWSRKGAEVLTATGSAIDFASNNYLGLASDGRLVDAARRALESAGVGAGASRLINGDHPEHEALEVEVAQFFETPAALTFNTGYSANLGTLPALIGPRDAVFSDALNHASLIDGCRLSRAKVYVYRHADMTSLRALLASRRSSHQRAIIATDGVFSMDGHTAPLPEIVELAREFKAWTYVDDAHGVGVLGDRARGTAEHHGVHGSIDVTIGTLGKAFGVAGAFAYGSPSLRRHLVNHARSFVFSTAMLPAQAAAARESLRIVASEPERRTALRVNAARLRTGLAQRSIPSAGDPGMHVVPVMIGDADNVVRIGAVLRARGLLVGAVRPPTVPDGTSRLRISVSAAHTPAHIDNLVESLAGLLPPGRA
jgi:8-amino-7-oxononanoate synthase